MPTGKTWDVSYTSVARATPAGALPWGVKHQTVTWRSPAITLADGTTHAPLQIVSQYSVANPSVDVNDLQTDLNGLLLTQQDGDAVTTEYQYASSGSLDAVTRNPGGGAQSVRTELDVARDGEVTCIRSNVGSALASTTDFMFDGGGQLKSVTTVVGQQTYQKRHYYDIDGNLSVVLTNNKTSNGSAPDDFGTNPRSDVAREWLREEFHYNAGRLVMELLDRRSLDRADANAAHVADVVDAGFLRQDYSWTPEGLLSTMGHGNGSATNMIYDGFGSLYKVEQSSPSVTLLVGKYFVNAQLEPVREYRGDSAMPLVTSITRNAAGSITQVVEPAASTPTGYPWAPAQATHDYVCDVLNRVTETTTKSGSTVLMRSKYAYDELNRPYNMEFFDGGAALAEQVFTTQWAGASMPVRSTGPANRFVERTFDTMARVTEVTSSGTGHPDKTVFAYFDKTSLLRKTTQRNWDSVGTAAYVDREVEYVLDNLGRVLQLRMGPPASPLVHSFSYYSSGYTETYTDPSGKVERYLPDGMGRLVERFLSGVNPIWNGSTYLDWTGQESRSELRQLDGRGRETRTIFDFAGRPIVVMEPGASVEPTAASPHQSFARFMEYDSASRLLHVYAGDDVKVKFDRDGAGRVLMRTRLAATANPLVSFGYGRDEVRWNALGQMTEALSRTGFGAGGIGDKYVHEYFERDGLGRLHEERFSYAGATNSVEIESTFAAGDPFRSGLNYRNNVAGGADDLWMQYVPDGVGRVQGIDWKASAAAPWIALAWYEHEGLATRRRTTTRGLGLTSPFGTFETTHSYDVYGRLSRIDQSFDVNAFVEFTYDLASNLKKEHYQKQGGANRDGDRFEYDEHHRLWKAWLGSSQSHLDESNPESSVGTFVQKLTYQLDAANNRSGLSSQFGQGGSVSTTAYTTQNAAPQGPSNRYDTVGGTQALYDGRGNTHFDGLLYYVYDALNRLTEVYRIVYSGDIQMQSSSPPTAPASSQRFVITDYSGLRMARSNILARTSSVPAQALYRIADPAYVAQLREPVSSSALQPVQMSAGANEGDYTIELAALYLYDVMNRRVVRLVVDEATYYYAWDGWQEAQELTQSFDGSAFVADPRAQFAWGEQLDELIAYRVDQGAGWNTYYIAEGGAHCPSRVLDSFGNVVEIQEYDPYGKTTFWAGGVPSSSSSYGNSFGWKGHRVDPETGLVYVRNRYYTPLWGRFLTQDPLGDWADWVNFGSGYCYGGDNVLIRNDRLGLQAAQDISNAATEMLNQLLLQIPSSDLGPNKEIDIVFEQPVDIDPKLPNAVGFKIKMNENGTLDPQTGFLFDPSYVNALKKGAVSGAKEGFVQGAIGLGIGKAVNLVFRGAKVVVAGFRKAATGKTPITNLGPEGPSAPKPSGPAKPGSGPAKPCPTTPGAKGTTIPDWVKDAGSLVNHAKNLEKGGAGATVTQQVADDLVREARKLGVKVRLDGPHPGTPWDVPHLNVGDIGVHVPVPQGYALPP
jgi:RHS repeat-associated protein